LVWVLAVVACDGGTLIEPGRVVPRSITSGDYALTASGLTRSQAWNEGEVVRYEGTLNIQQDDVNPSRLYGTFVRLESESPPGLNPPPSAEGVLTGTIDERGNAVIELRSDDSQFIWRGRGIFIGPRINGEWTTSYDEAGGFTAQLLR
jgi:hypothetical protein